MASEAGHVPSDGSEEINAAPKKLLWPHDTSAPSPLALTGLIERATKSVKEGTTARLIQPALDEQGVNLAMRCYSPLRSVVDKLVSDTSDATLCKRERGPDAESMP